jgi:hypothetical protein
MNTIALVQLCVAVCLEVREFHYHRVFSSDLGVDCLGQLDLQFFDTTAKSCDLCN